MWLNKKLYGKFIYLLQNKQIFLEKDRFFILISKNQFLPYCKSLQ